MPTNSRQAAAAGKPHRGVVVPMVTPLTAESGLDEPAVGRVIEHLLAGGVHGVFVLGTTGEMPSQPASLRRRLVEMTVQQVGARAATYAGIADNCLARSVASAGEYFDLGVGAVVAHLPTCFGLDADEQHAYFAGLLEHVPGPVVLYNMPPTTHMSIPIEVVRRLAGHPRAAGLKDSENDPARLAAVLKALGGRQDFSILTGVTGLSAKALLLGADGMVPSSGNLVPGLCRRLFDAAAAGDSAAAERLQQELDAVGRVYQAGRSLAQSLAALKAAMSALGLCGATVAPPLRTLDAAGQEGVRKAMESLKLA